MWAHAVGKMAPIDLFDARLPQTFKICKKRNIYEEQYNEVCLYAFLCETKSPEYCPEF
jgi:hypothetical protein